MLNLVRRQERIELSETRQYLATKLIAIDEVFKRVITDRWASSTKMPRAELIVNLSQRQIQFIDSGKTPNQTPREFRKSRIDPLLKNCTTKIAVVVVIKQKNGIVQSYPQQPEPISFASEQGVHLVFILDNCQCDLVNLALILEDFSSKFFIWRPLTKFRMILVTETIAHLKLDLEQTDTFGSRVAVSNNHQAGSIKVVESESFRAVYALKRRTQPFQLVIYCSGVPVKDQERLVEQSKCIQQSRHLNQVRISLGQLGLLYLDIHGVAEETLTTEHFDSQIKLILKLQTANKSQFDLPEQTDIFTLVERLEQEKRVKEKAKNDEEMEKIEQVVC